MLHFSAAYFGCVRGVRLQCLRATACYNYADNFLHLCTETHESHTCLTLAKNSSIMEKLYLMVALKSNNHCISAFCNLVGRTYPMVTLKLFYYGETLPDGCTKI